MPRGGWFELVSCPHYTFEVLIYVALAGASGGDVVMLLVLLFVALELSFSALRQHAWYRKRFDDYPRRRCAIVPWVL